MTLARVVRVVPWTHAHARDLARIANDIDVCRYLLPGFPHPYGLGDATSWIEQQRNAEKPLHFAIEADGLAAGSIGLTLGTAERRGSALVGYFVGKEYWGRGIASEALGAVTAYAFELPHVYRLWANVMAPNIASMRVLEKAGYRREARVELALVDRFGARHDEHIFTLLRAPGESGS